MGYFTEIYFFDYKFIILTVFFAVASCVIGIEFSKKVRIVHGKGKSLLQGSALLAVSFWLTHASVAFSVDVPFSMMAFGIYSIVSLFFCFWGSFIALKISNLGSVTGKQYISGSILIAISILGTDALGYSFLFHDDMDWKVSLLIVTGLLTLGCSFSLFRFLIQITNDDHVGIGKWKHIGSVAAGAALAGIPFITLISIIRLDGGNAITPGMLTPFIFVILAHLLLMLVPDLFGDRLLLKHSHAYKSLFNHNPGGVFSVDLKGNVVNANEAASRITGYPNEELIGLSIDSFFDERNKQAINVALHNVLDGRIINIETQILQKQGTSVNVRITPIRSMINNQMMGTFAIVEDITEKKESEQKIKFLAYHDELTKLPNRSMVKNEIAVLAKENTHFSMMLIDFDRFKRINDTFGHSFGDKILIHIGDQLSRLIGSQGIVSRIGGDEFLILVPSAKNKPLAESIISEFNTPMLINGIEVLLTASMGIANYPAHTTNIDDLFKYADIAMYHSKENGANGYSFYNSAMADTALNKLDMENDLRAAIENKELMLYFQPKFNTVHKKIIGSEVLIRWKRDLQGFIPPNVFIPVAEESGLIVPLERFVIEETCRVISDWLEKGKEVKRVSINISLITLLQEGFAAYVLEKISEFHIAGNLLELEITERVVMKNEDDVNSTLHKLREQGIKISIDDFGTGYSSLSYLDKLNVDILKIDQSFIRNIQQKKEVISAIISLAKSLNLRVIAEGVETLNQVELLRYLGCEEVQGYYYSPPVPIEEFERQLEHKYRFQNA
ncbi:EAL domain-containing protein [Peribacillus sp. SCS-155]|uniref:bifunctional diguanylate cyclase/phosphodiesterase n=1 Tax=Peribacillus sedimenti TaxID=3115297 RepID=UPI0039068843